MAAFAQTNLQLYRQLHAGGYDGVCIDRVRTVYELAVPAFAAQYRASGKPFIAHLVGTASVLASRAERTDMIVAGLLHAAYMTGDFGFHPGRRRSPRQRAYLRERVGAATEALIARYDATPWRADVIARWRAEFARLTQQDRDILRLNLANVCDDFLDAGMCQPLSGKSRLYEDETVQRDIAELARLSDWPELADVLERAFDEFNTARTSLGVSRGSGTSRLRLPPSAARRLLPRIEGWCARRARRLLGGGAR